jgi:hypothetical protein
VQPSTSQRRSADNGSTALVVPTLPHERDDVEAKLEAAPFDPEVYLSGWGDEASQLRRECDLLRVQLQAALDRIAWLEAELAVRDPEAIETPVTAWIASLRDDERPSPDVVRRMSEMLRPYPVQLGIAEGTWIAERIVKGDWATFGATIDEALISFLGPARLSRELPPMKLAEVVSDWPEMFQAK